MTLPVPVIWLYPVLLTGMLALVFLQTRGPLWLRQLGIVILGAAVLFSETFRDPMPNWFYLSMALLVVALSFSLDFFAATWRSWYFRVHPQGQWGALIGGLLGIFIGSIGGFLVGTFLGALVGEIVATGPRSPSRLFKSSVGIMMGLFGAAALKLLLGLGLVSLYISFF